MKKYSLISIVAALILGLFVSGTSFAGYGQGVQDGSGPIMNIFDGTPVTVSGMVAETSGQGAGIVIDTGAGLVSVYGLGPACLWDALGIAKPVVGENITVNAYEVTLSDGSTKLIAASVVVGDQTIELRDMDTGAPIWRGVDGCSGRGQGNAKMAGRS